LRQRHKGKTKHSVMALQNLAVNSVTLNLRIIMYYNWFRTTSLVFAYCS